MSCRLNRRDPNFGFNSTKDTQLVGGTGKQQLFSKLKVNNYHNCITIVRNELHMI